MRCWIANNPETNLALPLYVYDDGCYTPVTELRVAVDNETGKLIIAVTSRLLGSHVDDDVNLALRYPATEAIPEIEDEKDLGPFGGARTKELQGAITLGDFLQSSTPCSRVVNEAECGGERHIEYLGAWRKIVCKKCGNIIGQNVG